jgi:DNA-binding CsgD family transcriptional regulator
MTSPPVRGRERELGRMRALLRSARDGRGGALALLGEAGMGRTTLLRALRSDAVGWRVLGTTGSNAERDLPLAGLHRLLEPVADRITELPAPQADAVGYAAGRGGTPDRFLLCCGVYGLLTRLAGIAPVLCWVDDAHWLDRRSLDVLAFAARRLERTRIALVLTGRPELVGSGDGPLDGAERLVLPALPDAACAELLRDRLPHRIPAGLRAMLVEQAAGNPLDLLELAGALDQDHLDGRAPLPDQLPADGGQRARYGRRFAALSWPARQAVLLVAAEPTLELDTLSRNGFGSAVREALDAGLLNPAGPPGPAVRATLYAQATQAERQAAHATLAGLLDGDRHAWHRAMAGAETISATAGLADQVADAALLAEQAGAHGDAWRRLERAAQLTVHKGRKAERLLAAAGQAWHAGQAGHARALLTQVRALGASATVTGAASLLGGEIELRDGEPALATHELAKAAELLDGCDRERAATALMLAGEARRLAGDLPGYAAIAARAVDLPRPGDRSTVGQLAAAHFAGVAATFAGRHAEAESSLRRAIRIGRAAEDVRSAVWAAGAAFALGDAERSHELAGVAVSRARLTGEPAQLPWALVYLALSALVLDRHRAAVAAARDGLAAATTVAQRNCAVQHLTILALAAALRGDERTALSYMDAVAPEIADRGLGRPCAVTSWAYACLDLAADRPRDALGRFDAIAAGVGMPQPAIRTLATPQLVEAAVGCGEHERAARALKSFDRWISVSESPQWQALSQRCHALLAQDSSQAEEHFQAAIRLHRRGGAALELARTQLGYAHWLRRQRRPRAARDPLREAVRIFDLCGALPLAESAKAELRAAGDAVPSGTSSLTGLTPQQATISRLVAAGQTNREIARRLVISHRTVDHHLRNIFATLGVRSRVELTRRVAILDGD